MIWEIVGSSVDLVESFVGSSNSVYDVGYLENGNFLVINTRLTTAGASDYSEIIESERYYFAQDAVIYNADNGKESPIELEKPVTGIFNEYSPTLSYEYRNALNLNEGYSMVYALAVNEQKEKTVRGLTLSIKTAFSS
jgi:hypothetical protein